MHPGKTVLPPNFTGFAQPLLVFLKTSFDRDTASSRRTKFNRLSAFRSQRSLQTHYPGTKLRQMMAPVTDTLRTNDPRQWGCFLHLVRCHSQRRYDFDVRQAEFLAKKMARGRSVRLRNFPIDPQDLLSSPLFR